MKEIFLAGGCFWSMQRYFDCVAGVESTQAGFANGDTKNPTYIEVISGRTGFAEAVKVLYSESTIPLIGILELYLMAIDPERTDMQDETNGPQFRVGIYYADMEDGETVMRFMLERENSIPWCRKVEVKPLENYYPAAEYHQHYLEKHPNGHCHISKGAFTYAGEYRF